MRIRLDAVLGVVALLVPLGLVTLPAAAPPPPISVPLPSDQTSICPVGLTGTNTYAAGDADVSAAAVGAVPGPAEHRVVLTGQSAPTVLRSQKRFAAGTFVADGATTGWSRCLTQRTSSVVQFARPKTSDLLLVNADEAETIVDLTLLGPAGEIQAQGSKGIVVSPRSSRTVPISALVADDTPIGVALQTSSGRVAAVGRTWATAAGDFINTSIPSQTQLIAGLPAGAKTVKVLVTNPGTERASVDVTAFGRQAIALANAQKVSVEPGSTSVLDITASLGADAAGLRVSADQRISASVIMDAGADIALSASVEPLLVGRLLAPAGGTFSITNPAETPVTVTLSAKPDGGTASAATEIQIPPGQTWTMQSPTGTLVTYDVLATGPVLSAVTMMGASGALIAPLESLSTDRVADVSLTYDPRLR